MDKDYSASTPMIVSALEKNKDPFRPKGEGDTIGKHGIFLGFIIFLGTEEYNRTIFIGTKTEEDTWHRHT
jgi:hypothetical protein